MIGVSYTGHDGRKSSFGVQGAEDAASRMAGLTGSSLRETMSDAQGLLRMARKPGAQPPAQPPAQKRERVMPGGSVVRSPDGAICLRGEELDPLVPGTKVFGAKGGDKGFFAFDEIDPPVHGAVVGREIGDESQSYDANDAVRDRPDGTAWAMRYLTEEKWKQDNATGLITAYKYFRLVYYSALGRAIGCSKEWREVLFSFVPGSGSGNGKYGVRAFTSGTDEKPSFSFFAFGAEADLDTWDEDSEKFTCNYNDNGTLKNDPPVKMAEVDVCDCPVIEEMQSGG